MKSKKIVITGGLGYIGMELAKLYSGTSRIHSVTIIDNSFYLQRVAQIKRWGINFIHGDILDKKLMSDIIRDADIVYHLAGITDVSTTIHDSSKKNDQIIKKVGINGTKNVIEFSNKNAKIIFTSTHVIY